MKKLLCALGCTALALTIIVPFAIAESTDKVIVYYFHTSSRCPACHKIEQYTKEAVEQSFDREIKAGTAEFKAVNTDEEENNHFLKDYNLYTKSVVLSLVREGKEQEYKNLPKIWEYVPDRDKFISYIKAETGDYLAELKQ